MPFHRCVCQNRATGSRRLLTSRRQPRISHSSLQRYQKAGVYRSSYHQWLLQAGQTILVHVVCNANTGSPDPYNSAFSSQAQSALGLCMLPPGCCQNTPVAVAISVTESLSTVDSLTPLLQSSKVPVPLVASYSSIRLLGTAKMFLQPPISNSVISPVRHLGPNYKKIL